MRLAVPVAALLAAAGCATVPAPVPSAPGGDPAAAQVAREAALGLAGGDCAAPGWAMTGRLALSNGKDGGSGRIEWTQGDGHLQVTLSAPVTRQAWVLHLDGHDARLEGVPNGPLRGDDAAALLRDATGWDIPVAALGCWLRGARHGGELADVSIQFAGNGLPSRIEQQGWQVEYQEWTRDAAGLPLPAKLVATRGASRIRLVVDRWGAE